MNRIIICGDEDGTLTKTVVYACARYGGAFVCDGDSVYQTKDDPAFTVITRSSLSYADFGGVIVFGDTPVLSSMKIGVSGAVAVTDSGNKSVLTTLSGTASEVIGCSMSEWDTVSLSSCEDGEWVVSLRRSIRSPDESITDPCEIAVRGDRGLPLYSVMAACCVLLLCGVPHENGYLLA